MKNKVIIASLASAVLIGGCNGGNSTASPTNSNKMNPVVEDVYLSEGLQAKTVASVSAGTSTGSLKLNATNDCFKIVPTDGKNFITQLGSSNNQWWSTASIKFTMKNTCPSAQSITALPIRLRNVSLDGKALSGVGDIAQSGSPYLTVSGQLSGSDVLVSASTPACSGEWCSWAQVPAGGTHTFTVNTSLSSLISKISLTEVVIDGSTPPPPPPVEETVLAVNVQSSSLTDLCKSTSCNIKVKVISPDSQESTINVNPVESPNYTVNYHGVLPGQYTMAVDQASLPAGVSFAYTPTTGEVSVNKGMTNTGVVAFSYTKPVELGNLNIKLNAVSDSASNFNGLGNVYGQVTDTNTGTVYTFDVAMGGAYSLTNIPANHKYTIYMQGIGNAQKGSYYAPITKSDITVANKQTQSVALSYTKATNTQVTAFSLTGEKVAAQNVMFATEGNSYKLMTNNTLVSGNYTFIADQSTTITSAAPSGYTVTINPQVITSGVKAVTVNYAAKPIPTNVGGTYDFAVPTGTGSGIDYSGKFQIFFNPNATTIAKSISFVSNVPNLDKILLDYGNFFPWGVTPVWTKEADSQTGGTKYTITFVDSANKATGASLAKGSTISFTWNPDKQGVAFDQVVPIISQVVVNDSSYVIDGACTNCTDPGKGKAIVGYQEQWSVYPGHKYMPEDIPFAHLNTINYAFIDFVTPKTYPFSGAGKYGIVTADGGGDYRQLVALWKEKQRRPYLKVVLSFGGWTNDNEKISPDINFNQMTDAQQRDFAKQAAQLVKVMGFDGVDIDWEWWANHRTTSQDACGPSKTVKPTAPYCQGGSVNHNTQKYINLLKYLRAELGNDKLLTIATVSAKDKILSDEDPSVGGVVGAWKQIASYVNYINIMAYDMHGAFDNITASQAPWDIDPVRDPFYGKTAGVTIKTSIQAYIDSGVPVSKLVLGMPAYGRSSIISNQGTMGGLYQASNGAPKGEFDNTTGVYTYKCLLQGDCHNDPTTGGTGTKPDVTLYQQGSQMFNNYGTYALTPWGSSSNMFITFDDQNSVKAKLNAACKTFGSLGGGMVWALDGDTSDSTSITKAIMDNIHCN